ncbi:lactosylceramide 4-alpha-galactosyltransferase-like [Onthophagus taurus]|uniref:lactosylceramide 4-alpha-galactosyltransferase-like n=1 Tax=Onthophagus taurus TaxID=166361 RepID=UPI0039BEC03D
MLKVIKKHFIPLTLIVLVVNAEILQDIQSLDVPESSIFFLETTFRHFEKGRFELKQREACSIESAALHHPERTIFVIYAAPGIVPNLAPNDKFLNILYTYPNIKVVQAHIGRYLKNTPVDSLYWNRRIDLSPYKVNHYSDLLRTITLWKYGGIYMDTDIIVLKSLNEIGDDFVTYAEKGDGIEIGVIGLSTSLGSIELLDLILKDINKRYNPNNWTALGSTVYFRWIKHLCKTQNLENVVHKSCADIKILPSRYFHPIYWKSWRNYFNRRYANEVLRASRESFTLHIWNSQSNKMWIKLDSAAPIINFAKKNCPKVFKSLTNYF